MLYLVVLSQSFAFILNWFVRNSSRFFSDKDWIGPIKSVNQQILSDPFCFGFPQKSCQLQRAHTFQPGWKLTQIFCLSFSVQKYSAHLRMIGWSSLFREVLRRAQQMISHQLCKDSGTNRWSDYGAQLWNSWYLALPEIFTCTSTSSPLPSVI